MTNIYKIDAAVPSIAKVLGIYAVHDLPLIAQHLGVNVYSAQSANIELADTLLVPPYIKKG